MLFFESGTLLLWETVTILSSRDVIHRGPGLFKYMEYVTVSVIILTLFDSHSS